MAQIKSWRAWVHGLIGAILGSIATAGLSYLGTVATGLDLKPKQFGITVGMAALVQGFLYVKQSPIPFNDEIPIVQVVTPTPPAGTTTTSV